MTQQHQIQVALRWKKRTRGPYGYLRWRDIKGERQELAIGYRNPEDAERQRAELEARLRLGAVQSVSVAGYIVSDLLTEYIEAVELSPTSDGHKDRVAGDCINVGRHLGRIQVDELGARHVRLYLAHRSREKVVRVRRRRSESDFEFDARVAESLVDPTGKPVASTTIRNELATLRRAMTWAKDERRTTVAPIPVPHRKSLPNDQRPPRRLTEAEVARLIAAAGSDALLVQTLAWSGRRPVAIFGLRASDLVRVTDVSLPRAAQLVYWAHDKDQERTGWGPVTQPAWAALRRASEDRRGDEPVFQTPGGRHWASTGWPKRFARIARAAEVRDVVSYDLRKHACAQLARRLGSAHDCIAYSGHKTVETFMRHYAYALEGSAESRAATIDWTPQPLKLVKGDD